MKNRWKKNKKIQRIMLAKGPEGVDRYMKRLDNAAASRQERDALDYESPYGEGVPEAGIRKGSP